ncbi:MAG TPA: hypothetical protein VMY35_02080 [Phycisphaerae bacterium]|nr:hypothetical protein [Phycisphaerae bacterium]
MAEFLVTSPMAGLSVLAVADANAEGSGTITAATADTLTWTAPGSNTAGTPVAIADGETKTLADGTTPAHTVTVKRTSADDLEDTATVFTTALASLHDRLVEVDAAITKTLNAISEGFGDMRVQRESLDILRRYRQQLYRAYANRRGIRPRIASADLTGNF